MAGRWRSFNEFVKYKNRQIDTSRVNALYDRAETAVALAVEWDAAENGGRLFERVNAVTDLGGDKYGLFASALGRPDQRIILTGREAAAQPFPSTRTADRYPQLTNAAVVRGFPIQINVRQILSDSANDLDAVKRIGGVAVHEATHAADYSAHENEPGKPNLTEVGPEENRKRYEAWFDRNQGRIVAQHPALRQPSRAMSSRPR